jgi:hypothetical protein
MRIGCLCFGLSMARLGLVMLLVNASHAQSSVSLPNVIVLLADDLGYADIGIHGATEVSTPNNNAGRAAYRSLPAALRA